ncbi:MAG: bacterioferritin [Myxococcota bacterium]
MNGDPDVIHLLNAVLTHELTAINQYFVHAKMLEDWGYRPLGRSKWKQSIVAMKEAEKVIERVLFLDGVPNLQRLDPVRVGESATEMHELDLQLGIEGRERLSEGIKLAYDKLDHATRELLEELLHQEEEDIDWHEAQLHQIEEVGKEMYLASWLHEDDD